jgi:hypothetical protein
MAKPDSGHQAVNDAERPSAYEKQSPLTVPRAEAAIKQHGTIFFNCALQPVEPKAGQWFCEFFIAEAFDGYELRDEAIVEYVGQDEAHTFNADGTLKTRKMHCVAEEGEDGCHEPRGDFLILQH